MGKLANDLRKVYGLIIPENPSNEWLKSRLLQRYYVCYMCGESVSIHKATHVEKMFGKRVLCPKCARLLTEDEHTEEAYPIPIN